MQSSSHLFPSENNFDFLRFFAALMVFIGHSYILFGNHNNNFLFSLENTGLFIFFTISGFLITASWKNNPQPSTFFKNRALRIFPALIFPVIAGAYIIGPLTTILPLQSYFLNPHTHLYLANLVLITVRPLPGVFSDNIYPHDMNGSLWTLPLEFLLYCAVAIIGKAGQPKTRNMKYVLGSCITWIIFLSGFFYLLINFQHLSFLIATSLQCMQAFALGALACIFYKKLPLSPLYITAAGLILLFGGYTHLSELNNFVISYLVIGCAFAEYLPFRQWAKYGDFSYGFYIYAFPAQQTLMHFFPGASFLILNILAFIITICFAILSWHVVEKKMLRLKIKPLHAVA